MKEQTDQDKDECKAIVKRHEQMVKDRQSWENNWAECLKYIIPRKQDVISERIQGDKRGEDLFDTTAIMANEMLSGALHSMLTNQATKFFDLVMGDPELDNDDEVKEWLQEVADIMHNVMNSSNFQTEVHEIYMDLGAIGTACLYTAEHDQNVVHFSARAMKEVYAMENNLGLIDIVHREFSWFPRQIVQEFGEENLHEKIIKKYKENSDEPCKIIHAVEPKSVKDYHQFKSTFVLKDENLKLHQGNFTEFPFAVPRWTKTTGETYGRGPGMAMLPDIKMVNEMMRTTLEGGQMTVRPPMMVQDDGVVGRVRLTPAGLTVVRDMEQVPIRALNSDARIDFGIELVRDVRSQIKKGFYTDQLLLKEGPQMTATEVNQRTEETLRLMGPVLGRQHFEFLRPTITRVFGICNRKGMFPPAPAKIVGKNWDVRYSSLVARAQRMSEGTNITRAMTAVAPIVNAVPSALHNLDADAATKFIFEIYGMPQKIIRSQKEIAKIREAEAKAAQEAAAQQQQMHQAEMVSKAGPTAVQAQMAQNQR